MTGVDSVTVVRSLEADELPWFVGRSLTFIGHSDPQRLALLLASRFGDAATVCGTPFAQWDQRGDQLFVLLGQDVVIGSAIRLRL